MTVNIYLWLLVNYKIWLNGPLKFLLKLRSCCMCVHAKYLCDLMDCWLLYYVLDRILWSGMYILLRVFPGIEPISVYSIIVRQVQALLAFHFGCVDRTIYLSVMKKWLTIHQLWGFMFYHLMSHYHYRGRNKRQDWCCCG